MSRSSDRRRTSPASLLFAPALFALALTCALALAAPTLAEGPEDILLLADFELGDVSTWSSVTSGTIPTAPDAFRMTDFDIRDPHFFVNLQIIGCTDVTDNDVPVINLTSVNNSAANAIVSDVDEDGCLDFSSLLLFRELDQQLNGLDVDGRGGRCAPPASSTTCSVDSSTPKSRSTYTNQAAGFCLDVLAGTSSGYTPAITETPGPCFVTAPVDTEVQILGDLTVPLKDFQSAGTFDTVPANIITNGLARGFLRETDADAITLPPEIPILGGSALSILFPGGTGNCDAGDDRDMHGGASGWWIYMNYEAERVPWSGL